MNPTIEDKNIIYTAYLAYCVRVVMPALSFAAIDSGKNGSWDSFAEALGVKPAAGLKLWGNYSTPTA